MAMGYFGWSSSSGLLSTKTAGGLFFSTSGLLWVLGVALIILQPRFIQPAWYRWLVDHHGDVLPQLRKEARKLGRHKWAQRVRTQEGLERWVRDVRRKYGVSQEEPTRQRWRPEWEADGD